MRGKCVRWEVGRGKGGCCCVVEGDLDYYRKFEEIWVGGVVEVNGGSWSGWVEEGGRVMWCEGEERGRWNERRGDWWERDEGI